MAYIDIEKQYPNEFLVLTEQGKLVDDWANVYQHCKTEGIVAHILAEMLHLVTEEGQILVKAAILHDWYKRNEREMANQQGHEAYAKAELQSAQQLLLLGYPSVIVNIAHSVGSEVLPFIQQKIQQNDDILTLAMHYIDDVCLGDKIVELDERMDALEAAPRYKELNESGRAVHNGRTYFEVQREVGHQIQNLLAEKCGVEPNKLITIIKQKYEESIYNGN